ncbi:MAG: CapA family protein [bacterium]|nr:CapA family protein [bacterium]
MKKYTKLKISFFAIFPIVLGVFIASFIFNFFETSSRNNPKENYITANIINSINTNTTEIIQRKYKNSYTNQDFKNNLKVSANAYVVGDLNTGEVILSKNIDKIYPIASVSKLMTALVAKELENKNITATVSKKALATYGGNGNFRLGEKINTKDLLYPLLLESSNDAAEVLAEHYGRDNFIKKLNLQAQKLTMNSTSFEDPSGLSPNNKSTVGDLFKLAGYLKNNKPEILDITKKKSYSNGVKKHTWFSINQFLRNPQYIGGKSGFTDPAKQTVISTFSIPLAEGIERPIGITLLQSTDRAKDVNTILKYLKKNIYYGGDPNAMRDWVEKNLNLPDISEPDFITMHFLGDIMLDRGVRNSVNKNFNGDYSELFTKLDLLKDSDIVFANLEGTASDKGKSIGNLYSFRMDPSVVPALKGAGINILSVANNHVGDWGLPAYIDTLERLKENEILYTGGGTLAKAEQPTIIEKYGMKIGFLGFTDVGPNYMKVEEDRIGILLASNPKFEQIIKNASSQVDYLVVSFHWGVEYKKIHNARQEELAHKAIDNGAKIIVGHHPHVIQDTEVYKNGFIAYSLGNFIFDQKFSTDTMQGMMLELKLGRLGNLSVKKNTIKLNSVFQPDKIIFGKEEKVKFE